MNMSDKFWRSVLAPVMGGVEFDKPGGGYSFSKVLEEERNLAAGNIPGDSKSALLCLSIADPTWRMPFGAFFAGVKYFFVNLFSSRYTDNFGVITETEDGTLKNTHEQLADYLNMEHAGAPQGGFTPEWVQYSPGAIKRSLSEFIPTALFDSSARLIFPTPGYGPIKDAKNNRGIQVIEVPMVCTNGAWDLDYDEITAIMKEEPGVKTFVYLNMPHNPTGSAYDYDKWELAIAWAIKHGVIFIVDEAYHHIRYDNSSISVLEMPRWYECCIVLQSVSKGWSATGLRFGWIVAHPTFIKAIQMVTDVKDSGMFGPSIAMGLWCLEEDNLKYTDETSGRYCGLHAILAHGLNQVGFDGAVPEAGLCQFTRAPRSANGVAFANSAECAQWFRKELRISLMHYTVSDTPWLRWAVTLKPVPECGLPDEASVIKEVVRRLQSVKFEF